MSSEENRSLQPDVVLVGFDFDGEYFFVRGGEYSEIHKIQKYSKK
jgi:hypothetical protein